MKRPGVLKLPSWAAGLLSLAMFAVLIPAGCRLVEIAEWAAWSSTAVAVMMLLPVAVFGVLGAWREVELPDEQPPMIDASVDKHLLIDQGSGAPLRPDQPPRPRLIRRLSPEGAALALAALALSWAFVNPWGDMFAFIASLTAAALGVGASALLHVRRLNRPSDDDD